MSSTGLEAAYRRYIARLNMRDLDRLGEHVHRDVEYNGEPVGLAGYRRMIEGNYRDIPDLKFTVKLMVADTMLIASRLEFDCTPHGDFLGLPVNGRRVLFSENVIYAYEGELIGRVWSVIDKAAIEAQLSPAHGGES